MSWLHSGRIFGAVVILVMIQGIQADAATATWITDADGDWNNNGNWDPGTGFPDGVNDNAVIKNIITADRIIDLVGGRDVSTLTVNHDNFIVKLTNSVGGGTPLVLNQNLTNIFFNGSGTLHTKLPVSIAVNPTNIFVGDGSGMLNIGSGFVTSTVGNVIIKQGTFKMRISNTDSHLGILDQFILENGTLSLNNPDSMKGVSNLTIRGGAIGANGNPKTITNMVIMQGDYSVGSGESGKLLTFSGPVLLGTTTHSVNVSATYTNTWSGVVSGSAGISQIGAGTLVVEGNNTFTGNVTNSAGVLMVNSANALGTTTKISATGGTLLFNTGYTNTSATLFASGGSLQNVDNNVSLGSLTLTANSTIDLHNGGSAGSFRFATATNLGNNVLTITGWSGSEAGGTDDLIFFTTTTGITSSFLSNVSFANGFVTGAQLLPSGELVPITPEPSTMMGAGWLIALMVRRLRRKESRSDIC